MHFNILMSLLLAHSSPARFPLCVSLTSSFSSQCLFLPPPWLFPAVHLSFPLSLPFYLPTVRIRLSLPGVSQATWQVTFFAPPSVGLISNFTLSTLSSLFTTLFPLSLSISRSCSVPLCHHLHLSTNPSELITLSAQSTQGTNLG